ncbi:hypothetical protein [Streptomyces sp. EN27]|uniref:hypothetical protein n=1 Tax=Streptomyces sp. EN27 TaxID=211464 RepID=UPI000851BEC0|nr:hypothetical protein [Streptomyces sp. EN27]
MPEKTQQHWTESLFDSVYALYKTAHEYQLAHRATQLLAAQAEFDRHKPHEGRIALEGHSAGYGRPIMKEPHPDALFALLRVYGDAASEMHRRYEEAALLFASGAAWAIRSIQLGHTPPVVSFQTDQYDNPVQHRLSITGLTNYAGAPALGRAYEQLARRLSAADHAVHLAEQGDLADHEAGEFHDAVDTAMGIADSAYAYGLLAQRAVNFVLLEPRRAREREIALARAAARTDQPTP